MLINKISPFVNYNQWLKRLDNQLNKPANQNPIDSPKLLSQQIRDHYYKTLGTSVIDIPSLPGNQFSCNNIQLSFCDPYAD